VATTTKSFFYNAKKCIDYNGKKITVWCLFKEDDRIVIDIKGNIYSSWWPTPEDFPTTPGKRARYAFNKTQRSYRMFSQGIVSFQRGLRHALVSGNSRILTHKEWSDLLTEAQAEFCVFDSIDPGQKESLRRDLESVNNAITRATSQPLEEAGKHLRLALMFEDSLGRFNIGVVQCRTTAAFNRIRERIDSMYAWSSDFNDRLASITHLNNFFQKSLVHLEHALQNNISYIEHNPDPKKQILYLTRELEKYKSHFMRWTHIKPYDRWVRHTFDDIHAILFRLSIQDHSEIPSILNRMLEFTRFKIMQHSIDTLIFILSYSFDDDIYKGTLLHLLTTLGQLDAKIIGASRITEIEEKLAVSFHGCNRQSAYELRKQLKEISLLF